MTYLSIISLNNLKLAHIKASKSKGHYRQVREFNLDAETNLINIHNMLKNKEYRDIQYTPIIRNDKGKERLLMKLDYSPHRIIQWAIMLQCEDTFTNYFAYHSCASVKNGGTNRAITLLQEYLYKHSLETRYCLKIDVKQFYPSIDKKLLYKALKKNFKDKDLLYLFKTIIDSYPSKMGIPIGSYLSQYFANYYLTEFDYWLKDEKKIDYVVRYMDDIVILHNSKEFLHNLRKEIQIYWRDNLKLEMKSNYQVFPVDSRGVDFVGYRVYHTHTLLRPRNRNSLRTKVKKIRKKIKKGQLLNKNEFASLNSRVGFFKYCSHIGLFKTYIRPYMPDLGRYYNFVINKDKSINKTFKYLKKLGKKMWNR